MSRTEWVAFAPRDTVLVRDGRQFDAGTDTGAEATLPGPSTMAGAVRTAYGGMDEHEPDAVRGPLFAVRSADQWVTFLPTPRDIVVPPNDPYYVQRLRPKSLAGVVTDLSPNCPQWLAGDGESVAGWISGDVLTRYLHGQLFAVGDELLVARADPALELVTDTALFSKEARVGLARERDRVVKTGLLYQATHLRPVEGLALLAECDLPDGWAGQVRSPTPLGGRGRLADVSVAAGVAWPRPPEFFPEGRVVVYVATAAIWPGGWRIPLPSDADLVAAVVDPPIPVATASPRLGMDQTRALRWAVPPGSVYLLSFHGDGVAATEWASRWHGKAYGREPADRLSTAGFGIILTGVWS